MVKKKQKSVSKEKTLFLNTILFAIGNIGSSIILFLLLPLYTNMLTTEEYGVINLITTFSNLMLPVFSLQIGDAVLRFGLSNQYKKNEVLKITIFILTIGSLIAFVCKPLINLYGTLKPWSGYVCILIIVCMFRSNIAIYIKTIGKNKCYAFNSILYTFVLAILNIIFLVYLRLGIRGYIDAMIIATTISAFFLAIEGNIFKSLFETKLNVQLMKKMIIFSVPMIFNAISWWINNFSDRFVLNQVMGATAVGMYSVAAKMPSLVTTATGIFNQAWAISSINEYDSTRDEKFYSKTFRGYSFLLVIISSFVIMIIKPFMNIYVGHDFRGAWEYVPFLLIGAIFLSYAEFFAPIYSGAMKNVSIMITTVVAAIANIVLNCILIPIIGIHGAVFATMISYFMVAFYRIIDIRRIININIEYKKILINILILLIQSLMCIFNLFNEIQFILFIMICLININEVKEYGEIIQRRFSKSNNKL